MSPRKEIIDKLQANPEISVLIIGAGVNGIGTFRDLALQGVDVLLVDRDDFCTGASIASSHMLHGGIRYLENGEFRLVNEALHERNRMLVNAPHYAKPLRTTIPMFSRFSGIMNAPLKFMGWLDKPGERGALVIKLGLMMYDFFTRDSRIMPKHTFRSRKSTLQEFPALNPDIAYSATYYDAWMPTPERICMEMILDAECENEQAYALNHTPLIGAEGETVTLYDEESDTEIQVKPKIVVNAAGAWIDLVHEDMNIETKFIGGTKGSHIIVDHPGLYVAAHGTGNEIFFENQDGRIVLIFAFAEGRTMIGTTDIHIHNPDKAVCTDEEIDYILGLIHVVFPNMNVTRDHIVHTFSGVRPLPYSDANTAGQISRDHSMKEIDPNHKIFFPIVSLIGGKWTTFRAFSEQVADFVLGRLALSRKVSTANIAIGGGKNYPENPEQWVRQLHQQSGIDETRLQVLFERYGTYAEKIALFVAGGGDSALQYCESFSRCEIQFLIRNEKVIHLDDLLLRRTLLGMLGYLSLNLVEEIASIQAETLAWSEETTQLEIERVVDIMREKHRIELGRDSRGLAERTNQ